MDIVKLDNVQKQLKKLPAHIKKKLFSWTQTVEYFGIHHARKIKGYHDEPLKGKRLGQRSIRLSRQYRAIYRENKNGTINLIIIEEVSKHEY